MGVRVKRIRIMMMIGSCVGCSEHRSVREGVYQENLVYDCESRHTGVRVAVRSFYFCAMKYRASARLELTTTGSDP